MRWAYLILVLLIVLLLLGWWVLPDMGGEDAAPDVRPDAEQVEPGAGGPPPGPSEVPLRRVRSV